jgi:uncharacterized membrane protein
MKKVEFLKELEFYLQKMNTSEKNKFVIYYDEMISDYIENGVSEEEAIQRIGTPMKIAEELLADYDSVELKLPSTGSKAWNRILTIIGFPLWGSVLLTVILFVFSIYILIWCVPIAAGAGCAGFFASSIVGIVGTPFVISKSVSIGIIQLGTSIASIGISVLLGIVAIDLSKRFINITKLFNVKLVTLFKKKVVIR